ncbi:unnamed protein product [Linum trigynum]|uniref:La protein 1 n=1 Tax=Linum trigynum TaxID=586398 RepID=A0AAV2EKH8_9ROSI
MATPSLDEATAKEVLRQVEFYFSDSNLPRDKFLSSTVASSEDGLVSLALICSFKKMRGYLKLQEAKQDEIPEDTLKAVADTLAKSASLKLSEDGKRVGRIGPLMKPEELVEQLDGRTIAASPLPYDVSRDALVAFFGQYGQVTSLRLPNHIANKRVLCGTALVEFPTDEEAKKVLGQILEFEGVQLELKPKKEFDEERQSKLAEFRAANPQWNNDNNKNSSPQAEYTKGLIVAFKLKSISTGDEAKQDGNQESVKDGETGPKAAEEMPTSSVEKTTEGQGKASEDDADNNKEEVAAMDTEKVEKADNENVTENKETKTDEGEESNKDSVEKNVNQGNKFDLSACKNDKNIMLREDLKVVFSKFGAVKYIDFKMGEDSGYARFEKPEAGQKARAAAILAEEGGLTVKNFIVSLEPIYGDKEAEYWAQVRTNQDNRKASFSNRGGRGGRFHRGGKHPRSRDNDSGRGGRNKFQKVGA